MIYAFEIVKLREITTLAFSKFVCMIRNIIHDDIPAIKNVLENCDLFPSEYLEEMIRPHLNTKHSKEIWFTHESEGNIQSIAYCAPMALTNGTYNLYAIGIHKKYQHQGIGTLMMKHLESILIDKKARVLIVETSSSSEQEAARKFYLKCGYTQEATIREFWDEGDDKVIFWKKLELTI